MNHLLILVKLTSSFPKVAILDSPIPVSSLPTYFFPGKKSRIYLSPLCTCLSPGSFEDYQKLTLRDCLKMLVAIMATLKFIYFEKATI